MHSESMGVVVLGVSCDNVSPTRSSFQFELLLMFGGHLTGNREGLWCLGPQAVHGQNV